jgi:hypothetical protein
MKKQLIFLLAISRFTVMGRGGKNRISNRNPLILIGSAVSWLVVVAVMAMFTPASMSFADVSKPAVHGQLVMRVQKATPARVLVVPGAGSIFVQLSGQGLDRLTAVRVSEMRGKTLVAVQGATARITMRQPNTATIEIAAAKGTMYVNALIELGLIGVGGTFFLPQSMVGIGIVPPGQPGLTGVATSATGVVGSGPGAGGTKPSLGSISGQTGVDPGVTITPPGSGTKPQSGKGAGGSTGSPGGVPSLPGRTGGQPISQQTSPSSMMQGQYWSGSTSMSDKQSSGTGSGESQSVTMVEFYVDEKGTRTTITTNVEGGHTYQAASSTDTSGKTTESLSVDGKEVAGTDSSKSDKTDSASTQLEPTGKPSFGTVPTKQTFQPTKGNVDPAQDSAGKPSGAVLAPGTIQGDVKKGLGGDSLEPTSTPPRSMPTSPPNKGNVDPVQKP